MSSAVVEGAIAAQQSEGAREYLDRTLAPVLLQGLQAMCRDRPLNPADYLAMYLLKRSTKRNVTVEVPLSATVPVQPAAQ
jgi:hypothetical protein